MSFHFIRYAALIGLTLIALPACKNSEQATAIASDSNASLLKPLASSYNRTCAMSQTGVLKCWGLNDYGQLGLGDLVNRGGNAGDMGANLTAVDLGTGRSAKSVSMADWHTCAILDNDKVKCWGWNGDGELGLGDTNTRGDNPNEMGDNLPYVDLGTGRTAKSIAAGGSHTCAILDNDKLKCWGYNMDGELGYEHNTDIGDAPGQMGDNLPYVNLGTGRTAKYITNAGHHTCALLDNGTVKCWGHNGFGQLGVGHNSGFSHNAGSMGDNLAPIDLGTGRTAKAVISGGFFNCAILDNDKIKCWGRNNAGQLGLGDTANRGDDPNEMGDNLPYVDLGGSSKVSGMTTRSEHVCATIMGNSKLKCWGVNDSGQLGLGDTANRGDDANEMGNNLPEVELGTSRSAKAVATGHAHTCTILDDYSVKCWGNGWTGMLGYEDPYNRGDQANQMGNNLPSVNLAF